VRIYVGPHFTTRHAVQGRRRLEHIVRAPADRRQATLACEPRPDERLAVAAGGVTTSVITFAAEIAGAACDRGPALLAEYET
jgi:hypothetical protein